MHKLWFVLRTFVRSQVFSFSLIHHKITHTPSLLRRLNRLQTVIRNIPFTKSGLPDWFLYRKKTSSIRYATTIIDSGPEKSDRDISRLVLLWNFYTCVENLKTKKWWFLISSWSLLFFSVFLMPILCGAKMIWRVFVSDVKAFL